MGGCFAVFLQQTNQAGFAKFFAIHSASFRHAVGEQQHAISGQKLLSTERKTLGWEDAQHGSTEIQAVVRAVTMGNDGSVMPGVRITEFPGGSVQVRVEKRDEAVAR